MTRDEAKSKLMEMTANECTPRWMDDFIDSAVALGMLKLQEKKPVDERLASALTASFAFDTEAREMKIFHGMLADVGLKITEK